MRTAQLLTCAAKEVFPEAECIGIPVADGGEGTVDALIEACGGERIYADVQGPLGTRKSDCMGVSQKEKSGLVRCCYGKIGDDRAVIEMAAASGLTLISKDERNPLITTTYGTGELIKDALDRGFTRLFTAIGGSATNDGGMGCAKALGIRFFGADGRELEGRGCDLIKVRRIDVSGLDPRLKNADLTVMCDVTNPLCGENGATYTFAGQKGADRKMQDILEEGMINYRDVIRKEFGVDPDEIKGGGAAGGLGTALTVFLGGKMKSGIETVLDLAEFDKILTGADLVVTGEGRADSQSCQGKVVQGVGKRALKAGVPAVAICGSIGQGAEGLFEYGIGSLVPTAEPGMAIEEAMARAEELYLKQARKLFYDLLQSRRKRK